MMPPVDAPRPDRTTLNSLVAYLENSIDRVAAANPNPGRTVLHRLNRHEYANAIRDIFALEVDAESLLPPDEQAYGFDNVAEVLGVSPSLMDRYLTAAWKVASTAVGTVGITPSISTYRVRGDTSQHDHVAGLPLGTRGGILIEHTFPVDGEYVFRPELFRNTVDEMLGLDHPNDLELALDGERVLLARFGGPDDREIDEGPPGGQDVIDKRFEVRMPVTAGRHIITVAFIKKSTGTLNGLLEPFMRPRIDDTTTIGIPELERVSIDGPFNVIGSGNSGSRQRIFTCHPSDGSEAGPCAESILSTLGRLAYRRPVTDSELRRLMSFYQTERDRGRSFDAGIEAALAFMLVSPQFIFRFERDPSEVVEGGVERVEIAQTQQVGPDGIYRISDLELASRLSFFVWSSVPDDELLDLAVAGRLQDPAVLEQQVVRMLADERARALGSNFAGQWLFLRNLESFVPNQDIFPDFDHNLRTALQRETEMLFESIVLEDRNVLDLLRADYTFLNERLAKHYDIPGIYGTQFRRVRVTQNYRRGLLGHAGIMIVASGYPNRTSPVSRGKYILTNILGTPPPEPPPNVPPLDETPDRPMTMRERMAAHRGNPACSGCHQLMDPIGLALENFDGIGRWRTDDGGVAVDSSGVIPIFGELGSLDGPVGLQQAILSRPDQFVRTLSEMLLTYALGRGLEYDDLPIVRSIVREAGRNDYRFSSVVLTIVKSDPFRMRALPPDAGETIALNNRSLVSG